MEKKSENIVFAQMQTRQKGEWTGVTARHTRIRITKQRLRSISISAAAVLCLGVGAVRLMVNEGGTAAVMNHVTTDFEYDDTLGRLQFVSNILPESAMVFLEGGDDDAVSVFSPAQDAEVAHVWSQAEPWYEYACTGDVAACSDGDVMTIVKNREDEYTIRLLHDDGYESVYSGLNHVSVAQYDRVMAGETLGQANGTAAFEYRKDGLSILPTFESQTSE